MTQKLYKNFKKVINSSIFRRVITLKKAITATSAASLIDLLTITLTSKLLGNIANDNNSNEILLNYIFIFIGAILIRTFLVYILKQYSFTKIFEKKNSEELNILKIYVRKKVNTLEEGNNSIEVFKETLIHSTEKAAQYFDVPIVSFISESLFAICGVAFLLHFLGIKILIINTPIFLFLLFFARLIALSLHKLGQNLLLKTEKRLITIDNLSEVSLEISALRSIDPLLTSFERINKPFNQSLTTVFIKTNSLQIMIEALSLLIILISMISIISGVTNTSFTNYASTLAILSRMVPSVTRCIANFSQLQYGIAPVKRLAKLSRN
tara:strand:- start:8744 stop:9715 length:972 start_codon:yes stop_codon:yes gene_type:complete